MEKVKITIESIVDDETTQKQTIELAEPDADEVFYAFIGAMLAMTYPMELIQNTIKKFA